MDKERKSQKLALRKNAALSLLDQHLYHKTNKKTRKRVLYYACSREWILHENTEPASKEPAPQSMCVCTSALRPWYRLPCLGSLVCNWITWSGKKSPRNRRPQYSKGSLDVCLFSSNYGGLFLLLKPALWIVRVPFDKVCNPIALRAQCTRECFHGFVHWTLPFCQSHTNTIFFFWNFRPYLKTDLRQTKAQRLEPSLAQLWSTLFVGIGSRSAFHPLV